MALHGPTRRDFLAHSARVAAVAAGSAPLMQVLATAGHCQLGPAKPGPRILNRDGIEFIAVEPGASSEISVVAQCLDNQWVPRPMLHEMAERALPLASVAQRRETLVRTEYIRSLINSERVICNRAYLFNNSVVFNDFVKDDGNRKAFKALLGAGVIVPYLYSEGSPLDKPAFDINTEAFEAWRQICQETRVSCIRMSWDDDANKALSIARLARPFHNFAVSAAYGNARKYANDLGISESAADRLAGRLGELSAQSLRVQHITGQPVTRTQLYRDFVTLGNPVLGQYDLNKPFSLQIKELIDLSYNAGLPDALSIYALTPRGTLARTSLQELEMATEGESLVGSQELLRIIRNTVFALVTNAQYVGSLQWLTLEEVIAARSTDEWIRYRDALSALLADPTAFSDAAKGAPAVFQTYAQLAARITSLAKGRLRQDHLRSWQPKVEIQIERLGGDTAALTWTQSQPTKPTYTEAIHTQAISGAGRVAAKGTSILVRLIIGGAATVATQADLAWNVDIMRTRLAGGLDEWNELKAKLAEDLARGPGLDSVANIPTVNYRG